MASKKSGSKKGGGGGSSSGSGGSSGGGGGQTGAQGGSGTSEGMVGLFIVCYEIGGQMPGAPLFRVNLAVNTPHKVVTGQGHITQAINPPLDVATSLHGTYTYMTVMPNISHILVTAVGYPIIDWPPGAGVGPVIPPNAELRMLLSSNWQTGTANFRYLTGGNWNEIEIATVKSIPCNTI